MLCNVWMGHGGRPGEAIVRPEAAQKALTFRETREEEASNIKRITVDKREFGDKLTDLGYSL
jgi:hypothetical protein